MFSSFFSTTAPDAQNFFPVSSKYKESELFGELEPKDTEWLATASGFVTETQVWYISAEDRTSIMCEVIHSAVGMWYPQIQFTCRIFNEEKKISIWKSVNITNFLCPPPGLDKRSSKGDQFSITHKSSPGSEFPESYTISANLGTDVQVFLELARPAAIPGFKIGKGPDGGYSYFGADPAYRDGYVTHRFWPRYNASGHLILNGQAQAVKGPGMFIHAIQGMRPNLVACRWNFADFQSDEEGGVSCIQMEFTTQDNYGEKGFGSGQVSVNVGSMVVGGKLATVTAETKYHNQPYAEDASVVSRAIHAKQKFDPDTGYPAPGEIIFEWAGPSLIPGESGVYRGVIVGDMGPCDKPHGLVEKVDVLAEIPYVVKMAVNYVAGTKPYIYQWFNPGNMLITKPGETEPIEVKGMLYNEATFISP
ncbi:oxidative stress survival, Svf1-like protein [Fistulina hepatica ATCC 64428]|nr:oxidative stress survival, Svf1-like protein [Fistulina hepatica ATCC 64428]